MMPQHNLNADINETNSIQRGAATWAVLCDLNGQALMSLDNDFSGSLF